MKTILPTLKEKKRYISFEVIPKMEQQKLIEAINNSCLEVLGEINFAKAGIQVADNIIRVDRKYVDHAKTALTFIDSIGNTDVIVKSVRTSGTIKKLKDNHKTN